MRLLFIRWHPSPRIGGLAVNTEQLMAALVSRGHTVGELAARYPKLTRPTVERGARILGGLVPVSRHDGDGVERYRAVVPERALRSVLARFRPDALIVNSGGAWRTAWAERMLNSAPGFPAILYVYDIASAGITVSDRGEVVAISEWVAAAIRARGINVEVIPPIIDRERYRVTTTRQHVLLVNPSKAKGVDIALRLAAANPDIPFEFAGGKLAAGRQAPANVICQGWNEDLSAVFARARLLLVPSRYPEAWPRVIGEAQASGIPALASDVGGMQDAVGRGGMLMAANAEPASWLAALQSLWHDERAYAELAAAAELEGRRPELRPAVAARRLEAAVARACGRWPIT